MLSVASAAEVEVEAATTTAALRREEGLEQTRERREVPRLDQNLARARELRDHPLAADHAAEEAGRGLAQCVLRRPLPRDHVPLARGQALTVYRAEGREQQEPRAAHLEDEQPLAAEEGLGAAPARVHVQAGVAREVGAGLDEEELVVHLDGGDVAGAPRGEGHLAGAAARREGRDEGRLAADGAFESTHQPALHLRLQLHVRGHRDHRPRLGQNRLLGREPHDGERERGLVEYLERVAAALTARVVVYFDSAAARRGL